MKLFDNNFDTNVNEIVEEVVGSKTQQQQQPQQQQTKPKSNIVVVMATQKSNFSNHLEKIWCCIRNRRAS